MSKSFRKSVFFFLLLAVAFACGPRTTVPSEASPTPTPTITATPTPTPIPSPLGQIAYGSSTFNGDSQVVLMDLQTGNVTSLTAGFAGEYYRPVWSPDGGRLAMREEISMDGGGIAVMTVGMEGGRPSGSPPSELYHGFADGPTWSPHGASVAFVSTSGGGSWTAYLKDLEGGPTVRLPGIPQHATDLAWSPDGTWIAFSYYDNPSEQIKDIYIIHPDGTGLTRLTNTPDADEDGPAWSPDSRQIAFSGRSRTGTVGPRDIFRMNVDGTNVARVTADPASEFDPAWSPDGTQIAFTSTRHEVNDGNYEIYIINVDGTGELRLTNNRTTDRWPTWRTAPAGTDYGACPASAVFVADVTIPEGTRFAGPQEFTKVWRIQNSGSCGWAPAGYGLRFGSGEMMGGADYLPLSGAIQPGDAVELSLTLTAPVVPGRHSGTWVLYDNAGHPVPGPDGLPLTLPVTIEVLPPATAVLPNSLYFLSDRSGSAQIWRMENDGATVTQITNEPAAIDAYALSPEGGTIAYTCQNQLILIRRDGTDRRIAVDFGADRGGSPAWSPDGRLAYARNGVRIYNPSTGEDQLLIANNSSDSPASFAAYFPRKWSPDGTKLLVMIGRYEWAEAGILSAGGSVLATSDYPDMFAWMNDSLSVLLASATYPMMSGMNPGLHLLSASGVSSILVDNAFVWLPFHRPDSQLTYFVSRPAAMDVTAYNLQLVASAADGSGEHALRSAVLALDSRDAFSGQWWMDGSAVAVRIVRPASGVSEILLIPAGDDPFVFLMREGSGITWDVYMPG
ncbi:MAG: NBR1-Ig-like domain-containing protein [Anaerolineales bacterium]